MLEEFITERHAVVGSSHAGRPGRVVKAFDTLEKLRLIRKVIKNYKLKVNLRISLGN